jgi:hypothetical protein
MSTIENIYKEIQKDYNLANLSEEFKQAIRRSFNEFMSFGYENPTLTDIKNYIYEDEFVKYFLPKICNFPIQLHDTFNRVVITGDGSCLFHALSHPLTREIESKSSPISKYNAKSLRNAVCNTMTKDSVWAIIDDQLKYHLAKRLDPITYFDKKSYISRMRRHEDHNSPVEGGYPEIFTAAQILKRDIYLYEEGKNLNIILFRYLGNPSQKIEPPIFVYHCASSQDHPYDKNHFELLIPKNRSFIPTTANEVVHISTEFFEIDSKTAGPSSARPVGPASASARPVGPARPARPARPVRPVGPVGPVGPARPVGPVGPVRPVRPARPSIATATRPSTATATATATATRPLTATRPSTGLATRSKPVSSRQMRPSSQTELKFLKYKLKYLLAKNKL